MSAGKMDIPIACNDRHQEKQCYKIFFKCYNISYISNITFKLYNFLLVSKILYNFRFYNFLLVFFSKSFSTFYFAIFPFDSPDFQGDFVSWKQIAYFWLQLIWGNILSKWNPVVLSILWSVNLTLKNGKTEFHWSVCSRLQADHGYIQTSTCIYTHIQFKCVNAGLKSFATTVNG